MQIVVEEDGVGSLRLSFATHETHPINTVQRLCVDTRNFNTTVTRLIAANFDIKVHALLIRPRFPAAQDVSAKKVCVCQFTSSLAISTSLRIPQITDDAIPTVRTIDNSQED